MRSGNARATAESCVSSSRRTISSTSIAAAGSSGITGERIWRERAEDRQVDCLGRQPVAEDGPKLANVTSPDEQREVRYAARRLARVLVDHECPRRLSNRVSNLLTADRRGHIRSASSREPPQERSAWALIRRIGIFDDVRRRVARPGTAQQRV
jgi:hypothetical protein